MCSGEATSVHDFNRKKDVNNHEFLKLNYRILIRNVKDQKCVSTTVYAS